MVVAKIRECPGTFRMYGCSAWNAQISASHSRNPPLSTRYGAQAPRKAELLEVARADGRFENLLNARYISEVAALVVVLRLCDIALASGIQLGQRYELSCSWWYMIWFVHRTFVLLIGKALVNVVGKRFKLGMWVHAVRITEKERRALPICEESVG